MTLTFDNFTFTGTPEELNTFIKLYTEKSIITSSNSVFIEDITGFPFFKEKTYTDRVQEADSNIKIYND